MSDFDHEVLQKGYSTSNIEFSRVFQCSRTQNVRCALQTLALSNLLGAEVGLFDHEVIEHD